MEDNDAMQRKLRFIKDDLMNKTLGELLNMLKDAAASGDEASSQSAKYLEYMLSCGVVRSSDPANTVHMSGLAELVQVLAVHRLDTVTPVERPVNGFPVQMALSDLGPESPEHAAVRKAISSNADEDTIKKAKAALVDSILRKAERNKDAYGVSDFNADDPMSFIRYLMKKVSLLESRCGRLEAALASIKDSVKRISDIKAEPVSRHESVLDRKIRAWFDGMENHLPDDDDPWWQLPPPPGY